jgi:hypothetical protein
MALEEVVNGGLTEGGGAGDAAQIEQGSAYGTGGPAALAAQPSRCSYLTRLRR